MKKSYVLNTLLIAFLTTTLFISCESEGEQDEIANEELVFVTAQLASLGFDTGDLVPDVMEGQSGYLVEGDIFLTVAQIEALSPRISVDNNNEVNTEHYRTNNIVSSPRVVTIFVDTAFPSVTQTAADEALARYNSLNLGITFQRASSSGADIDLLARRLRRGVLGQSAGFPDANGNPATPIILNSQIYAPRERRNRPATVPADVVTVIAHEIGHAIGFRHTDFFNRSFSCGTGGDEGDGGVGAIFIPGTPAGAENGSWMLACSNGTDRPFTSGDRTALTTVY